LLSLTSTGPARNSADHYTSEERFRLERADHELATWGNRIAVLDA